jgi:hypothetical protein
MKIIRYFYKSIHAFFYDRLGSDKHTSDSASISILTLLLVIIVLILTNIVFITAFNFNILKESNQWVIFISILILYLAIRFFLIKIIKN